jgi:hypothetical protein
MNSASLSLEYLIVPTSGVVATSAYWSVDIGAMLNCRIFADTPVGPETGGLADATLADIPVGPLAGGATLADIFVGPLAGANTLADIPVGPLSGGHAAPDEQEWFNGRGFVLLESQVQSIRDTVVALDPHLEVRGIA